MAELMRVFAGECTTTFEGPNDRTQRGRVVTVLKPDRTVLVHDADGYQPVAWLTRPDSVTVEEDDDGFSILARADDQRLRVVSNRDHTTWEAPAGEAGIPVGDCPSCSGPLVRVRGEVTCLDCSDRYGLPAGATVLESACPDCGLPTMRVERGAVFELCVDYACEPLADAVRDRFDREWDCPDCASPLRVINSEGRLFLGCDRYPECETTLSIPSGVAVGECDCGLPTFSTASGERCIDGTCEHWDPATDGGYSLSAFLNRSDTDDGS